MNGGDIAALIAAGGFVVLVLVLAVPLLRLRHTVDAATRAIRDLTDRTTPVLAQAEATMQQVTAALGQVRESLDGINAQVRRVDAITAHAESVAGNVAGLVQVVSSVATNPLVKVAAFGYGVRRAAARRAHGEADGDAPSRARRRRWGRRRR
ncbi:MAG: DUF948 domain-containing protein [Micromonosporaceae bacterium]